MRKNLLNPTSISTVYLNGIVKGGIMAIKYICDCCKEQIGGERFKLVIRRIPSEELTHLVNELCGKCVFKIMKVAEPKV